MAAGPVNDHGTHRLGEALDARAFRLWAGALLEQQPALLRLFFDGSPQAREHGAQLVEIHGFCEKIERWAGADFFCGRR